MKVALVHDWLTGNRGGEKVLLELVRLFPAAPIFTLFHFPGALPEEIERRDIRTSPLQRLVSKGRDYRKLLPLFLPAAETWDLAGFDLVLSSSHCVAKNARKGPVAIHVCYCHTPVRYLHDQLDEYLREKGPLTRFAARAVRAPLRAWDVSTVPRVDAFLANSENVRERIARLYGRPSTVVAPPADTDFYTPSEGAERVRSGLLVVSALAPYKRIDDAVRVANAADLPLTIAGFGPEEGRLRSLARGKVRFAGTPRDEELRELYRTAEAVLMPGEEDFGIVPVEAQACGTPVIALGRGGARETVVDGVTGVLYDQAGPEGLRAAIDRFRTVRFNSAALRENALRFSRDRFRSNLLKSLRSALVEGGRRDLADAIPSDEG